MCVFSDKLCDSVAVLNVT